MVLLCHIVGFNNVNKNEFIRDIRNINTQDNNPAKELIVKDIDELTDEYINNPATKLLNERLKIEKDPKKADQYKYQIEHNWSEFVTDKINKILKFYANKLVILIGLYHFIRNHRIKILIDTKNKIFVDIDLDINSKQIIELNVKKYMKDIINGKYPLKYLDYDFLKKQRLDMGEIYKNENYIFRPYANIIEIIKKLKLGDALLERKDIKNEKIKINGKNVVITSAGISNKNQPLLTIKKNNAQNWAYWASTQKLENNINPKKSRKDENKTLIYSEEKALSDRKLFKTALEALLNLEEVSKDLIYIKRNNKYEIKSLPNKLHKYCYLYKVNSSFDILSRTYISDLLDELQKIPEIIIR
jgi:hypothetical protein